jgi:uncharacterized protein (TIRG00374 family)
MEPGSGHGTAQVGTMPRGRTTQVRAIVLRVAAGAAIGAILTVLFLRLINLSAVYQHLSHLNLTFALLSGVVFLSAYVVRAFRWRQLLRPCQVTIGRIILIYQVATFLNWLLPVQGGELAKAMLLRRSDGIPVSRSLATVSMDKTMDLLPVLGLLVLLPVAGLHLSGLLWTVLLLILGLLGLSVAAVGLAAWRRDRTLELLTRRLARALPGRARHLAEPSLATFLDTVRALTRRPGLLLIATVCTAAACSLDALSCLLGFKAVGVGLSVPEVFYGYTFVSLATVLPTPPAHLGFTELVGLLVFSGLFGVNRSAVAAMFIFFHAFTGLLLACAGLFGLSRLGLSLRGALRLTSEESHASGRAMPAAALGPPSKEDC